MVASHPAERSTAWQAVIIIIIITKNNEQAVVCGTTNPAPSIAASRGLPELTQNVIRSSHGHSTPSLKISHKSVQPFSRNVADKEIKN